MNKINYLSLFSGVGAFEKGMENLNIDYNLINYCEKNNKSSHAYSLLYNVSEKFNLGDITKVTVKQIMDMPNIDLMTYGFPCQSFSIIGKRLGFEDENTGNLFFESMKFVKYKKPKYLIAENVKGLINHDNGNTFKTILKTLEQLGYNNYYEILNSSYFDIPQFRERIFIVSIRKDIDKKCFHFPKGKLTTKKVKDFIDKNSNYRYVRKSLEPFFDSKYHKTFKSKNGIVKIFDGFAQGYFNSDFSGKRIFSTNGISPTLTTKKGMAVFYEVKGELNALERFRLQGFTDSDYNKLKNNNISDSQMVIMMGNSITVNVIQAILKNLFILQEGLDII